MSTSLIWVNSVLLIGSVLLIPAIFALNKLIAKQQQENRTLRRANNRQPA